MADQGSALIVGAGGGLSASLVRECQTRGMRVAMAARNVEKLAGLVAETGARAYACDASEPDSVDQLFSAFGADFGAPSLVVYNASYRNKGPVAELDRAEVLKTLTIGCYGGFLVGQAAAARMLVSGGGGGSIQFTGASASVKGYVHSAPFAMAKFGLRGLAQSMARELGPKNIHVAHFVIDGGIQRRTSKSGDASGAAGSDPDKTLDPDAIARTYLDIHAQHRSAWTWEVELRPWVEKF